MKKGKLRIDRVLLVMIFFMLLIYIGNMIIVNIEYRTKIYEYQTEYTTGIGKSCGEVMIGKESCLVGNKYIPVKQYMEVK